jgi:hypothetical protein
MRRQYAKYTQYAKEYALADIHSGVVTEHIFSILPLGQQNQQIEKLDTLV